MAPHLPERTHPSTQRCCQESNLKSWEQTEKHGRSLHSSHTHARASNPSISTTDQLLKLEAPLSQAQALPFLRCPRNCHGMDGKTGVTAFPKPTLPSHPHPKHSSSWITLKKECVKATNLTTSSKALWPRSSWLSLLEEGPTLTPGQHFPSPLYPQGHYHEN